jgi:hypothetical protein
VKRRLARWLRRTADRIDHAGAPKALDTASFTFEPGRGMVFHTVWQYYPNGLPGCPLWFYGDEDYQRAHAEVVDRSAWIDTNTGQWRGVARP